GRRMRPEECDEAPDTGSGASYGLGVDSVVGAGALVEPLGLVVHVDGHLTELRLVGTTVVGAEEELSAASQLDADVRLSTAPVAAVRRVQRAGGNSCSHVRASFLPGVSVQRSRRSQGRADASPDPWESPGGCTAHNIPTRRMLPGGGGSRP